MGGPCEVHQPRDPCSFQSVHPTDLFNLSIPPLNVLIELQNNPESCMQEDIHFVCTLFASQPSLQGGEGHLVTLLVNATALKVTTP